MHHCAYCGRRLPLLHRIVGAARYCSKEHAFLHQAELAGPALPLGWHSDASGESVEAAVPGLPSGPDHALQDPAAASAAVGGDCADARLLGPAEAPFALLVPPAEVSAPLPPAAPVPAFEDEDAVCAAITPDRMPDSAFPESGPVPFGLRPVASPPRRAFPLFPLRPRRRIIVPAHRTAAFRTGPRLCSLTVPPLRPARAGATFLAFWEPGAALQTGASPAALQESASVLVLSFLDEATPGSRKRSAPLPSHRQPHAAPRTLAAAAPPPLAWAGADPLQRLREALRIRWAPRPPAPARIPARAALPLFRVPVCPSPPGARLEDYMAAVQPFRLHRMPLRALRLGPVRAERPGRPGAPPPLGRMAFLGAIHVPRAMAMPVRPVYRLLPAPADPGGARTPRSAQADRPPAVPRHGG